MPDKRLSEVIREECLADGEHAYEAFENMGTLSSEYPVVAAAVVKEAELRPAMGGPDGVLEKIARPFLNEELGKQAKARAAAQTE
jgi:hypothetical protein